MTDISFAAQVPILSPTFDKARRLSRFLARTFALFFWLTTLFLVTVAVLMWWPWPLMMDWDGVPVPLGIMARGAALPMALTSVPGLFMLHHARRLFGCFAAGEVFATRPVSHLRAIGIWLIVSAALGTVLGTAYALFTSLFGHTDHPDRFYAAGFDAFTRDIGTLVMGISILVAAYVMAEAHRIADDNASIL